MYTAHTPPWLLLTNQSLCPPAPITDQIHKASARRCLALLNVVLFHCLLAENSSLIISYPFPQPASLQSLHYFPDLGFLSISFPFIFSSSCLSTSQNNHMISHQNCHFLSRAKPVCRGRNKLSLRTREKPLGCSC